MGFFVGSTDSTKTRAPGSTLCSASPAGRMVAFSGPSGALSRFSRALLTSLDVWATRLDAQAQSRPAQTGSILARAGGVAAKGDQLGGGSALGATAVQVATLRVEPVHLQPDATGVHGDREGRVAEVVR